ncbi:outer membrane murein-binding lipoprotein Lpp [Erwinia toletana]|uniref:Outer membrane murein-binding lipoprotein Lpp n=1 Tax=Winslowiella toletana TaxID=92490 RepID=A0ABS4PBU9_9GAMM|nr:DUF3251 domain-containing protein [Winslowiella toletana]MBP2170123.1 outer membrane murein-binding lipoprotein Lpp [Winslowiella toletana]
MKMTNVLSFSMLSSMLLLAGCAAPEPTAVNQLHNEVGKLNQQMRQLTDQATVLEQQNQLNSGAAQGAWLLPNANTAVLLQSNVGELRLSLSHVEAEANGTRALLHIRAAGEQPLVPLTALVEWGELDPITGKPLAADRQSQSIELPSSLLPKAETTVSLRLSGIQPEQLGYVRVHDLVPLQSAGR